ncbi:arylamine N-acetyltransferase [Ancylobacter oerskovii]|uniref:Arylamine N-acetyltransferase n=1 Tax=Ancylobacter oerskovii TaxID=459519 RepID=A0ABW4Z5W1_9HYPH
MTRLCGGVDREKLGDLAVGNHLTLRVDLDRPYLAEVGVADAIIEPVPLAVGSISQRGFDFSIVPVEGGWLRFNNHHRGIAKSVDFRPDYSDEAGMAATQDWLMRDPGSPFTNALAVFRHTADGYVALQNDCLRHVTASARQRATHHQRRSSRRHVRNRFQARHSPASAGLGENSGHRVRRGRLKPGSRRRRGRLHRKPTIPPEKSAQDRQNGKRRTMIASSEKLPGPRRTSSRKHVAQTPCVGQASG